MSLSNVAKKAKKMFNSKPLVKGSSKAHSVIHSALFNYTQNDPLSTEHIKAIESKITENGEKYPTTSKALKAAAKNLVRAVGTEQIVYSEPPEMSDNSTQASVTQSTLKALTTEASRITSKPAVQKSIAATATAALAVSQATIAQAQSNGTVLTTSNAAQAVKTTIFSAFLSSLSKNARDDFDVLGSIVKKVAGAVSGSPALQTAEELAVVGAALSGNQAAMKAATAIAAGTETLSALASGNPEQAASDALTIAARATGSKAVARDASVVSKVVKTTAILATGTETDFQAAASLTQAAAVISGNGKVANVAASFEALASGQQVTGTVTLASVKGGPNGSKYASRKLPKTPTQEEQAEAPSDLGQMNTASDVVIYTPKASSVASKSSSVYPANTVLSVSKTGSVVIAPAKATTSAPATKASVKATPAAPAPDFPEDDFPLIIETDYFANFLAITSNDVTPTEKAAVTQVKTNNSIVIAAAKAAVNVIDPIYDTANGDDSAYYEVPALALLPNNNGDQA